MTRLAGGGKAQLRITSPKLAGRPGRVSSVCILRSGVGGEHSTGYGCWLQALAVFTVEDFLQQGRSRGGARTAQRGWENSPCAVKTCSRGAGGCLGPAAAEGGQPRRFGPATRATAPPNDSGPKLALVQPHRLDRLPLWACATRSACQNERHGFHGCLYLVPNAWYY